MDISEAASGPSAPAGFDHTRNVLGSQAFLACCPALQAAVEDVPAVSASITEAPVQRPKPARLPLTTPQLSTHASNHSVSLELESATHALSISFLHHHPQQRVMVDTVSRAIVQVWFGLRESMSLCVRYCFKYLGRTGAAPCIPLRPDPHISQVLIICILRVRWCQSFLRALESQ